MTPRSTCVTLGSAALSLLALLALSGCASVTSGTPAGAGGGVQGSTPAAGSSVPSTNGAPGGAPTTVATLAAFLKRGAAVTHTAHISAHIAAGPTSIVMSGVTSLPANGHGADTSITESAPGIGTIKVVVVGGVAYVELPAALRAGAKPWLKITADSSDPQVRSMASLVSALDNFSPAKSAQLYLSAASNLRVLGGESTNGVTTTHYSLDVDVQKVAAALPTLGAALAGSGLKTIPIQLWVDSEGRPVKLTESFDIQGIAVTGLLTEGDFNAAVHISAPPSGQVATR